MIESIYLQNFQLWRKLFIEFDWINVIVGPTNKGKTAILRALYWVAMSRPAGISIINHDADKCRVKVCASESVVSRARGRASPSVYKLNGKIFRAAGTSVPEEIENLLNLQEINFQKQFDPMFWITDSPGQISKQLNEVVNLEAIDKSLTIITTRVRNAKSFVEVTEDRISTLKERIKGLEWVKEFNSDLVNITALREKVTTAKKATEALHLVVRQVLPLLKHRQGLEGAISEASALLLRTEEVAKRRVEREELALLVTEIEYLQADKKEIPDLNGILEDSEKVNKTRAKLKSHQQEFRELSSLLVEINSNQNSLDYWNEKLKDAERKLKRIKICPTCGQAVKSNSSSHPTGT